MKPRGDYTPVRLFYDGRQVEAGEYIRSSGGSLYKIERVRPSPSRPYRRYLDCTRWPADRLPDDATVHPLFWYPRKRRAARTLAQLAGI